MNLDDILARLTVLPEAEQKAIKKAAAEATKGRKWLPNPGAQTEAYFSPADELFYGGQAGGGKSDLLIGLALEEHTISRIFRKQHNDRQALIERMSDVLGGRDGYNGSDHIWRIPGTDRVVRFGAMSEPSAWERYQGDATDLKGWDEITQFLEHEYRTVNAWLRTTKKNQRTRIVAAGNPPVTAEGLWVINHWAAWLDQQHDNPAKPGELRWYTTIGDRENVEVDKGFEQEGPDGQIIRPKSRTFIPAGLTDNPDLMDSDYGSTLMALPKHLRDALAYGQFRATLSDADLQVIPTEWVLLAQQRWEQRRGELTTKPMTAIGVDVAQGGGDRMVCVALHGVVFGEPVTKEGIEVKNPRQGAAMVMMVARNDPQINVDCGGGYGGGIVEHLQSNQFNVMPCKGAEASGAKDRDGMRGFSNKRAEWVWRFREALDPQRGDNIALPPGRQILAELTAFREKRGDTKTIQIESNDDIVKRIGRSPDLAWGFFFAWAEPDQMARLGRQSHVAKRGFSAPNTQSLIPHRARVIGRR